MSGRFAAQYHMARRFCISRCKKARLFLIVHYHTGNASLAQP